MDSCGPQMTPTCNLGTEMGYVCTPSNDVTDAIWTAFGATVGAGVSCLALSALTSSKTGCFIRKEKDEPRGTRRVRSKTGRRHDSEEPIQAHGRRTWVPLTPKRSSELARLWVDTIDTTLEKNVRDVDGHVIRSSSARSKNSLREHQSRKNSRARGSSDLRQQGARYSESHSRTEDKTSPFDYEGDIGTRGEGRRDGHRAAGPGRKHHQSSPNKSRGARRADGRHESSDTRRGVTSSSSKTGASSSLTKSSHQRQGVDGVRGQLKLNSKSKNKKAGEGQGIRRRIGREKSVVHFNRGVPEEQQEIVQGVSPVRAPSPVHQETSTAPEVEVKKTSPVLPKVEQKACSPPPAQPVQEVRTSPLKCDKVERAASPACEQPKQQQRRTSPIRPPSACTSPPPTPRCEQKLTSPAAKPATPKCTSPLVKLDPKEKGTEPRFDCAAKATSPTVRGAAEKGTGTTVVEEKGTHKATATVPIEKTHKSTTPQVTSCHGARVKRSAQPEADKPRLKAVKAWGEPSSADKTMADSDEKVPSGKTTPKESRRPSEIGFDPCTGPIQRCDLNPCALNKALLYPSPPYYRADNYCPTKCPQDKVMSCDIHDQGTVWAEPSYAFRDCSTGLVSHYSRSRSPETERLVRLITSLLLTALFLQVFCWLFPSVCAWFENLLACVWYKATALLSWIWDWLAGDDAFEATADVPPTSEAAPSTGFVPCRRMQLQSF